MKILVINSGSSTIKYRVISVARAEVLATGIVERIGEPSGRLAHRHLKPSGTWEEASLELRVTDHREGFDLVMKAVTSAGEGPEADRLFGIGHRVVHGGERFADPVLIDDGVVEAIRELVPLAPLHNPGNLLGIERARELYPDIPQVAVFDTSFHRTIPPHAFRYALPPEWYEAHRVRRYGFHGMSHRHAAIEAAVHLERPLQELNLITLHLGNGSSATAIRDGESVDTSMGMTPLAGLIMGTRSGDLDPAILFYLRRERGLLVDDIESLLNRGSGLKGLCGTNDMREILRRARGGDERAGLAIEMYCYRIRKYLGAYFAVLGQVDAIVFTGGIGENVPLVRTRACEGLERMGIALDRDRNEARGDGIREVHAAGSEVKVLVVPAGEELEIARRTAGVIGKAREMA